MGADGRGRRLTVIVRDADSGKWRVFGPPHEVVVARDAAEVKRELRRVESECRNSGRYAAGFISYEAAPGFDGALQTKPADDFPLLWFGLYDAPQDRSLDEIEGSAEKGTGTFSAEWEPSITAERYLEVFNDLQELIRAGDTYQVNFTYRLRARFTEHPLSVFLHLAAEQSPPFGAYIDTGDWVICSASPELFFHRSGASIESRPMKGTAARGLWFEQDLEQAERLRRSEKERAENVMIVDMVRNDLGRVARPGSVRVTTLFDVERYPTVLQLTSTVTAETDASVTDVMSALFPPASITGAPKARTMEIIAGVECSPRRIYTGTIGFIEPGGRAQFNVAIRSILLNRATGDAEYGTGGGIVADSDANQELAESRLKSKVLDPPGPGFDLLETMLWNPGDGYFLLSRHVKRLLQSADYFGFQLDLLSVRAQLEQLAAGLALTPHRIRMLVSRRGKVQLTATPHDSAERFPDIVLAASPIDPANPFLYHKTTNRQVYEDALAARPGFPDVLLYNPKDEVTESTIANVVVGIGGELFTPPVECGLLPGTLRAHLLEEKKIREKKITIAEVMSSEALYLVNSVRGLHPVTVHYKSVLAPTGL
jgi:para-aminobenzoate synthetase/4-amino-4-deoxychorismate lyase